MMSLPMQSRQVLNSWDFAIAAGEPTSIIRIQNLQTNLKVGVDAWGRAGKLQPVLISASFSLRENFETAAQGDDVDQSTIHYGILSKEILKVAKFISNDPALADGLRLEDLYVYIYNHLYISEDPYGTREGAPILGATVVKSFSLEIMLPKASLLGSGVSLRGNELFGSKGHIQACNMRLKLHKLCIPTLIGLNSNERLAKQMVMTNIEIDPWVEKQDYYVQIEQLVVTTIGESSFQTLEALATLLGQRLVSFYISLLKGKQAEKYPRFTISLSKPTAVTFADAPTIEILVDSNPQNNKSVAILWQNHQESTSS